MRKAFRLTFLKNPIFLVQMDLNNILKDFYETIETDRNKVLGKNRMKEDPEARNNMIELLLEKLPDNASYVDVMAGDAPVDLGLLYLQAEKYINGKIGSISIIDTGDYHSLELFNNHIKSFIEKEIILPRNKIRIHQKDILDLDPDMPGSEEEVRKILCEREKFDAAVLIDSCDQGQYIGEDIFPAIGTITDKLILIEEWGIRKDIIEDINPYFNILEQNKLKKFEYLIAKKQ